MKYDKTSFIAGLAVGRQLKGWAINGTVNLSNGLPVFKGGTIDFEGILIDIDSDALITISGDFIAEV